MLQKWYSFILCFPWLQYLLLKSQDITDYVRPYGKYLIGMHTNILVSPHYVLYYPNTNLW